MLRVRQAAPAETLMPPFKAQRRRAKTPRGSHPDDAWEWVVIDEATGQSVDDDRAFPTEAVPKRRAKDLNLKATLAADEDRRAKERKRRKGK